MRLIRSRQQQTPYNLNMWRQPTSNVFCFKPQKQIPPLPFKLRTHTIQRGNVIELRSSYAGSGLPSVSDSVVSYEYDNFGNKTAEQNSSANPARRTEYIYDSTYHQFVISTKKIGPVNLIENVQYDFTTAFGKPIQITDANGNSQYLAYDSFGRLTQTKADTESGIQTMASYVYSSNGSPLTSYPLSAKTIQYTGSGSNIETRVFKDGAGRELHTVQSATGYSR